jgi:hypothetical protein
MTKKFQSFDTFCQFESHEQLLNFLEKSVGFTDPSMSKCGIWISHQDIDLATSLGGTIMV